MIQSSNEDRLIEMFGFSFENDFGYFSEVVANDERIILPKKHELGVALHKKLNEIRTGPTSHPWIIELE